MEDMEIVLGKEVKLNGINNLDTLSVDVAFTINDQCVNTLVCCGSDDSVIEMSVMIESQIYSWCSESECDMLVIDYSGADDSNNHRNTIRKYVDVAYGNNTSDAQEYEDLYTIMSHRLLVLRNSGLRSVREYNKINEKQPIPRMYVILRAPSKVSEFSRKSLAKFLDSIAKLGRAAGIHVILIDKNVKPIKNICNTTSIWDSFNTKIFTGPVCVDQYLDLVPKKFPAELTKDYFGYLYCQGNYRLTSFILNDRIKDFMQERSENSKSEEVCNIDDQPWKKLKNYTSQDLRDSVISVASEIINHGDDVKLGKTAVVNSSHVTALIHDLKNNDSIYNGVISNIQRSISGRNIQLVEGSVEQIAAMMVHEIELRLLNVPECDYQVVFVTLGDQLNLSLVELSYLFGQKLGIRLVYLYTDDNIKSVCGDVPDIKSKIEELTVVL